MTKPFYIVQDGQSLYDVSIELFGHQDGIYSILDDNLFLNLDALYPGQKLYYTPQVLDKKVVQEVKKKSLVFATSSSMTDAPLPPPASDANIVTLYMYGLEPIQLSAPGEFTVPPSVIKNAITGEVIAQLQPGQEYLVIPFTGINDEGPEYPLSLIDMGE